MKFKSLFSFLTLYCCIANVYSDDTPKFRRHEVGFNATLFVKQFLNFGSTTIPFSPYQVTYKYLTKKDFNLRVGAGAATSKSILTQDNVEPKLTKNYSMNFRLGLERQSMISKHWKCYYGIDATYDYVDVNSEVFSGSIRDRMSGFGFGPILGMQYYINDRISIFTEMGFLYKDINSKTDIINTFNPMQNQSIKSNEVSGNFFVPTTLFVSVRI